MFKKEEKKIDIEEMFKNLGLEELDNDDKIMLRKMLSNSDLEDLRNHDKLYGDSYSTNKSIIAMYNQNYLFLKHILKLEKQNKQIIELLTEIKNK